MDFDQMAQKAPEEFTEEEKKQIIARAQVYGIRDVAEEIGIPWELIASWKRKPVEDKKKEPAPVSPAAEIPEEERMRILARAEIVGVRIAAEEAGLPWQTVSWWKKKMEHPSGEPREGSAGRRTAGRRMSKRLIAGLRRENRQLRKQAEEMEKQIRQIQRAARKLAKTI